jgi:hypothetical protein
VEPKTGCNPSDHQNHSDATTVILAGQDE